MKEMPGIFGIFNSTIMVVGNILHIRAILMRTRIEWTSWWRVFLKKEDGILVSPVYDRAVKWNAKALEHTIFPNRTPIRLRLVMLLYEGQLHHLRRKEEITQFFQMHIFSNSG